MSNSLAVHAHRYPHLSQNHQNHILRDSPRNFPYYFDPGRQILRKDFEDGMTHRIQNLEVAQGEKTQIQIGDRMDRSLS